MRPMTRDFSKEEPLRNSGFFGSPYASGPRYWLVSEQERQRIPFSNMAGTPFGSPYAPGPLYEDFQYERYPRYGMTRYGSPYAQGPAYGVGRMDYSRRSLDEGRYGSPYAPGPGFEDESGPYYGVAPRNYHRSDQRIFEDVNDRLMRHGGIDAKDIEVMVEEGEVILKGTVPSLWTKHAAEDTAMSVLGVEDVQNLLRISWSGKQQQHYYKFFTGRKSFKSGMIVTGRDGGTIGSIKEVRAYDFKVKREAQPDLYVPFGACLEANGSVVLDIPAAAVDDQGWPQS
jgi:hypothetical protein